MEMPTPEITAVVSPPLAEQSPWRSPVPYLFGGLSVMLGLIAFAILMFASSYWNLTRFLHDGSARDVEEGEADEGDAKAAPPPVLEEKYLVIMAGEEKPSFLATPAMCSWASSVGSKSSENTQPLEGDCEKKMEMGNIEAH